jgi:hypothetical protein
MDMGLSQVVPLVANQRGRRRYLFAGISGTDYRRQDQKGMGKI